MATGLHQFLKGLVARNSVEAALHADVLDALALVTVDHYGWPHSALLSAGEVLPVGEEGLAFCLWQQSTTSRNLAQNGRALLQAVNGGAVLKVRLHVSPLGAIVVGEETLAAFYAVAQRVTIDEVTYAEMVSGLRYRLTDEAVVHRWRAQIEALAQAVEQWGSFRPERVPEHRPPR